MSKLQRPLTVNFSTRRTGRISEKDVIDGINELTDFKNVQAILLTQMECRITFKNKESKIKATNEGIHIGKQHITVQDVGKNVTNVTIKDAPVELNDRNK